MVYFARALQSLLPHQVQAGQMPACALAPDVARERGGWGMRELEASERARHIGDVRRRRRAALVCSLLNPFDVPIQVKVIKERVDCALCGVLGTGRRGVVLASR